MHILGQFNWTLDPMHR